MSAGRHRLGLRCYPLWKIEATAAIVGDLVCLRRRSSRAEHRTPTFFVDTDLHKDRAMADVPHLPDPLGTDIQKQKPKYSGTAPNNPEEYACEAQDLDHLSTYLRKYNDV